MLCFIINSKSTNLIVITDTNTYQYITEYIPYIPYIPIGYILIAIAIALTERSVDLSLNS